MAESNHKRSLPVMSPLVGYVAGDLLMVSTPFPRRTLYQTPPLPPNSNAGRRPHRNFKVTFDGNPDELAFFMIQVGSYMEVHGAGFWMDRERVFELGTQLRGEAVNWLVGLVEGDALKLYNLEHFLMVLQRRFEDPLTEEKALTLTLRQGSRSVSDWQVLLAPDRKFQVLETELRLYKIESQSCHMEKAGLVV
uniref:Uncharacterized protein n=1 Tax=Sphaerodactylus townsendi TaxID=933632 RepID=A0ACB8GEY2_9SAUR